MNLTAQFDLFTPIMHIPITLAGAVFERDKAMDRVGANAGAVFREQAADFILEYLVEHGPSPGEDITDACKDNGIIPHDDRAFGPVYLRLYKQKVIEPCGTTPRRKGHATSGGKIWKLCDCLKTSSRG